MKHRVMIIFWRWELPDTTLPCSFETDDQTAILYCIHQDTPEEKWRVYLQEIAIENPIASFMLFLHLQEDLPTKASSTINFFSNLLLLQSSKMYYHPFSGGKEFIYFNPSRDTGLLWGGGGTLVKDTFYVDTKKDHSIFDNDERIISKYFNGVWSHYYFQEPKKLIFEAREHFIFELYGENIPLPAIPFTSYLASKMNEKPFLQKYKFLTDKNHFLSITNLKEEDYQELEDHFQMTISDDNFIHDIAAVMFKTIGKIP